MALITGLMAAGCKVHDIGLAMYADGLFRPVRARRAVRRDGDGLPQRQRLDRREDGRQPAAHLRARRDDGGSRRSCSAAQFDTEPAAAYDFVREFSRALHRRPDRPAEAQAQAQGGRGLRQRHRRRLCAAGPAGGRLRGRAARLRSRPHFPALQSQPRRHEDAARHARRGAATGPMSASASTATATAAAWSTTRARRSSPTRSASCWRATCRRCTGTRPSSST